MAVKRKGNKFFLEVFTPEHELRHIGDVIPFGEDGSRCLVTHTKLPERHFYIKGLGYPINEELLKMVHNAGIKYIVIPEQSKIYGLRHFLGTVESYLHGDFVHEPLTEPQRVVALNSLSLINFTR